MHSLSRFNRGPGGRAARARVEVLIMEVRRSAAIGKPMVDIGITGWHGGRILRRDAEAPCEHGRRPKQGGHRGLARGAMRRGAAVAASVASGVAASAAAWRQPIPVWTPGRRRGILTILHPRGLPRYRVLSMNPTATPSASTSKSSSFARRKGEKPISA